MAVDLEKGREQLASCLPVVAGAGQGEGEEVSGQLGPASDLRMQHRMQKQQPWPRPRGSVSGGLAAGGEEVEFVYHPRGVA